MHKNKQKKSKFWFTVKTIKVISERNFFRLVKQSETFAVVNFALLLCLISVIQEKIGFKSVLVSFEVNIFFSTGYGVLDSTLGGI